MTETEIDRYLALLEETIGWIQTAVEGMETAELYAKPDRNSWSINEILAHLRSCADVWGETIDRMLVEDEPTLAYVHPRERMKQMDYSELSFEVSFSAFEVQRRSLLARLGSLEYEAWPRGAEIKGRRHTVFSQVRRMALHEMGHWEQVSKLANGKEES